MKVNQFAIYRVNLQTSGGRNLQHQGIGYVRENKLPVHIEDYKQHLIAGLSRKDEPAPMVRERFADQLEISDVLVINREGEISCYYVDGERVVPLAGFIRMNPSGAVIRTDTTDYHFSDREGNWLTADDIIIDGKQFYLLEHTEFRNNAPAVILDAYGKVIVDQWTKGFNDEAKDLIRQSLQKPEPVVAPTQPNAMQKFMQGRLKHMEIWQKSFENGEYLRSVESGTEANYDMIDGRVNNAKKEPEQDKPKKRTSVIQRLRQKQVAIAVRDGKPVPKYLQQAAAQERNRR